MRGREGHADTRRGRHGEAGGQEEAGTGGGSGERKTRWVRKTRRERKSDSEQRRWAGRAEGRRPHHQ